MRFITVKSRAKINLSLDVIGKRTDGYHEVQMIMQQVNLFDEIKVIENKDNNRITVTSNCDFIPKNNTNIAYKAAEIIKERFNIPYGINIHIQKNIPVAAGLAGGSSNAAGVLTALNKMWDLDLSTEELMDIGVKIGADVPFCILGSAALAEGIGERLTPINGLKNTWIVLAKPSISVSTAEVYRSLEMDKIIKRPETGKLIQAIEDQDLYTVSSEMINVLETVTERKHSVIRQLKGKMMEYNALGSMMSGSGPTVFGIFRNYKKAKAAYDNLLIINKQTYLTQTYNE